MEKGKSGRSKEKRKRSENGEGRKGRGWASPPAIHISGNATESVRYTFHGTTFQEDVWQHL